MTLFVLQTLVSDIFLNDGSWILNSLIEIEESKHTPQEKMNLIKYHLNVAVDKYNSVFLAVNGISDSTKIKEFIKKITEGKITVKELIVLFMYAIFDLIIRRYLFDFGFPTDVFFIFTGIIGIRLLSPDKGVVSVIADMYKVANEDANPEEQLSAIINYIKQLSYKACNEYDKLDKELNKMTPKARMEYAVDILNRSIPEATPTVIKEPKPEPKPKPKPKAKEPAKAEADTKK